MDQHTKGECDDLIHVVYFEKECPRSAIKIKRFGLRGDGVPVVFRSAGQLVFQHGPARYSRAVVSEGDCIRDALAYRNRGAGGGDGALVHHGVQQRQSHDHQRGAGYGGLVAVHVSHVRDRRALRERTNLDDQGARLFLARRQRANVPTHHAAQLGPAGGGDERRVERHRVGQPYVGGCDGAAVVYAQGVGEQLPQPGRVGVAFFGHTQVNEGVKLVSANVNARAVGTRQSIVIGGWNGHAGERGGAGVNQRRVVSQPQIIIVRCDKAWIVREVVCAGNDHPAKINQVVVQIVIIGGRARGADHFKPRHVLGQRVVDDGDGIGAPQRDGAAIVVPLVGMEGIVDDAALGHVVNKQAVAAVHAAGLIVDQDVVGCDEISG